MSIDLSSRLVPGGPLLPCRRLTPRPKAGDPAPRRQGRPAAAATTASFSTTSTWDTGHEGGYTIANSGPAAITGWRAEFDLPSSTTVGTFWDALMTRSGNHYTFINRDYNTTVAIGGNVTFGFVAAGTAPPASCLLNGAACGRSSGATTTTTRPPGTTTTTSPPPPPGPGSLRVAPYVDMGAFPTPSLTDIARTTGLRGFSLAFVTSGLQRANPRLRVSLTLPVLPEGLTADGLFAVQAAETHLQPAQGPVPGQDRRAGVGDGRGHPDARPERRRPHLRPDQRPPARRLREHAAPGTADLLGELTRDRNACTGALFRCTSVPQQPFEFTGIFQGFTGQPCPPRRRPGSASWSRSTSKRKALHRRQRRRLTRLW
jgi:hypothetical protein